MNTNKNKDKNTEVDIEETDYESEYRKMDYTIRSKPESYFKPSHPILYQTWEDEFYGNLEDKIINVLDNYRDNYATFSMDNALFIEMIKHNIECNAFTKKYIDKHPDCVIDQINQENMKQLQLEME